MGKNKPTPLLVPESDIGLPLAQRRFPYRAAPAIQVGDERAQMERYEANQAISLAIESVRGLICQLITELRPGRPLHDTDDLKADTTAHICIDALPRYDRTKGVKVSTFVYACAARYILRNAQKSGGSAESLCDVAYDHRVDFCPAALLNTEDPEISHALRIIRSPEKYLDSVQARIISEYADGVPVKTIAEHVTKSRASVHRIFRSACAKIRAISESSDLPEYAT